MYNLFLLPSENRHQRRQKHRQEHFMASTAGQEIRGGLHTHSGDSSHEHTLELQK